MSLLTILAEINCLAREKSSQVIELVSHDLANATLACDDFKHFLSDPSPIIGNACHSLTD